MTARRLSAAELARQLGVSARRATTIAQRYSWLSKPQGAPPTYDPQFIARYRAMRGQPHRSIEPAHRDWLSRHLGEQLMTQPSPRRARRVQPDVPVPGVPGGIDPADQIQPGAEALDEPGNPEAELLIYPGELLTQGTTLAVMLPGDSKESYFAAKHVAIVQEGETAEDVVLRGIAIVNTAVQANVDDIIERWGEQPAPQDQ